MITSSFARKGYSRAGGPAAAVFPRRFFAGVALLLLGATAVHAQSGVALVRHAPALNGRVEGSVQQMSVETVTLNGNAAISGDLLVPGMPVISQNGHPTYGGTVDNTGSAMPSNYQVTLSGGASLDHVVRRTDAVALPVVAAPPAPTGTRNVTLNSAGQNPGDFATLRDLTLNGNVGQIAVPPGTYGTFIANGGGFTLGIAGATQPSVYNLQGLALNGNSQLQVVGPVVLTVAGNITLGNSAGSAAHPEWLMLNLSSGGLTLNGNVTLNGFVIAPTGTVTISGNSQLIGRLASDRLTLNGNSLLRLKANQPPAVALTAPADGAAFVAPATIALAANASDSDGYVTQVEFLAGSTLLGISTVAPYSFEWTGVIPGSYALTARATDSLGATTTSAPVNVTVIKATAAVGLDGLSYVYDGASKSAAVATVPTGLAVNVTYNGLPAAPTGAGSYVVTAIVNDINYAGSASDTLTIAPATPVLTWNAPATIVYGTALSTDQLSATANVPGTFTYTPAAGIVPNAGGGQTLNVTFAPDDSGNYTPAAASTILAVNPAPASVSLGALLHTYDGTPKSATAATAPAGLPVNLTYDGAAVAPTAAGSYAVAATINHPNYVGSATATMIVAKATPQLTWTAPADIVYGTPLSSTQLNASANVPGTFVYSPAAPTVLDAAAGQTLSVTFTPADAANYTPATAATSINVTPAPVILALSGLSATYDGTPKAVTVTTTPANITTSVTYDGSATPPTAVGSYAVTATVTQANYTGSMTGTLVIARATPVITWAAPADIVVGTALSATQLNATASTPGTFTYTPAAGTVLGAGPGQAVSATFTPADSANYNGATAATTINVLAPVPATIAFDGVSSGTSAAATTSLTWSHPLTATTGSSRVVVVGVVTRGSSVANASASGAKFNGVAMLPLTDSIANSGSGTFNRSQLFYLLDAALPVAGTYPVQVTFAVSQSTGNNPSGGAISLTNVSQSAPLALANSSGTGTANNISTIVSSLASGTWVVDTVGVGSTGANLLTNAAGMVPRFNITQAGGVPNSGAAGATQVAGASGTVTMAWKNASARVVQSLAVFAPALSVPTAPIITTQPVSQTVNVGANVSFTVAATGTAPISYQWFKDGTLIPSATGLTLALTNVGTGAAGSYSVKVSNGLGFGVSNPAMLTVNVLPPTITTQPQSQTVNVNDPVTLTVAATGTAPFTYQWSHDGAPVTGVTIASLSLAHAQAGDAGNYQVIVTNAAASVPSNVAVLTVNTVPVAPAITMPPLSQSVGVGTNVTFTVAATGTAPLAYQWQKDNVDIAFANFSSLQLPGVQIDAAGSYRVVVTNIAGTATSAAATLAVSALSSPSALYNLTGFATLGAGTTGGGVIPETDPAYRKVFNALDLANALKDSKVTGAVKVIEIMNDLNLGWNEIGATVRGLASNPFRQHNLPKLHPALIAAGVSLVDIQSKPGLTIFSANGAVIKHATFNLKGTSNIIVRNLKFDEMWEWDEATKGDYDSNDWDFIDLSNGSPATNVWIDHCTFTKSYDGIVDMKAGTQFVTMSWCKYIGDDGATNPNSFVRQQLAALEANQAANPFYGFLRANGFSLEDIAEIIAGHDKCHLLGSNSLDAGNNTLSATFHHQLFRDIWDRCVPRLRGGQVHNYNIFVDDTVALAAKRLRDARAAALSTALRNTLNNTYSFNPPLNGSISTEGAAILVEKSVYMNCLTPLRNNQTDVTNPVYTGKILSTDSIYVFFETNGSVTTQRGDSTDAGNKMGPFQAAIIPFSWNTADGNRPYPAPPMDDPADLESIVNAGAGAGTITWSKDNWLKVAY